MIKAILDAGRSQVLGLLAQVIAATPVIAMSIYLSRAASLAAVADFALLIGVSSAAFTLALLGLRTRILLDQLETFADADYLYLQMAATMTMALVIAVSGFVLDAPPALLAAVVLLRVGDSALDLVLGIDQVRRDQSRQLYGYLKGSSVKLLLVTLSFVVAELSQAVSAFTAFAGACLAHAIYAWVLFVGRIHVSNAQWAPLDSKKLLLLAKGAFAFCVAQFVCAFLTSAPRFALPGFSDRELAGAAGAALSVSTFIGMVYFAIWLRWGPRFGKVGLSGRSAAFFLSELALVFVLIELALWLMAAPLMSMVYGLQAATHLSLAVGILMSSGVFFLVMTISNLFKVTRTPWAESAAYLGGLLAMIAEGLFAANQSIANLLMIGALGMMSVQAIFLVASFARAGWDPV